MNRHIPLGSGLYSTGEPVAWAHPGAEDLVAFPANQHFATAAEAAKIDFMFYGETLSISEAGGKIIEPHSEGRLDSLTVYSALAAVTSKVGLMATVNTTYCDPYELAREYASLDAISGGRSGINLVTSGDPATAANFTVGEVPREQRYPRATEFVELTKRLWASPAKGISFQGKYFDVTTEAGLPESPQGRPVIMQSGESEAGRDFAAASADLVFTGFDTVEKGQPFYADVKRRVAERGRAPETVKIMAAAFVHVGETDAQAAEEFAEIKKSLLTPAMVQNYLGRYWGLDLSSYDVDGPLPDLEPDWEIAAVYTANRIRGERDPRKAFAQLKEIAERENLSMTGLVQRVFDNSLLATVIGSPTTVADLIEDAVDRRAVDGFVFTSALQPYGMDRFYDLVLPILRERGRFREDYTGETLRDHLGLPA